jgi:hypothetical protein
MSAPKKQKIIGLSESDLHLALTHLRKLRSSLDSEEVPESDPTLVDHRRTTVSPSKKCKIIGLSGLELDLALTQLRKLRSSVVVEEVPESDPMPADTSTDQLDDMITTLDSRINSPLVGPLISYLV